MRSRQPQSGRCAPWPAGCPAARARAALSSPIPAARLRVLIGLGLLLATLLAAGPARAQQVDGPAGAATGGPDTALWPERQRAFIEDGPGLLLGEARRAELLALDLAGRKAWIDAFLAADPLPESPENELVAGIDRRRRLAFSELLSFGDDRTRLLFLRGAPDDRLAIDCGQTFKPLEVWTYGLRSVVLYEPAPGQPFRLWLPLESKRVLYNREMEYWLEQWEELRGLIRVRRFDLQICPETPRVDDATGVEALRGFRPGRPTNESVKAFLAPPEDLAAWARQAVATPLPARPAELPVSGIEVLFPELVRQRMVARFQLTLPAGASLVPSSEEGEEPRWVIGVDGVIEQQGAPFDQFRMRFRLEPPAAEQPLALVLERPLRPERTFVVRLRLRDEVGGAETYLARGFTVPREPTPVAEPLPSEQMAVAFAEQMRRLKIAGRDSLLLVPPESELVLGLWRAEALVTGDAIEKVVFKVDEREQMTRTRRPFTAELRLAKFPTEQVVRAEGYDAAGKLVAADEIVLNQPRGALRVRILEPERGASLSGSVTARAEMVVPEERRVARVEFQVNDDTVATLERPPWEAPVEVPPGGEVAYLTVVAVLDDGSRAEEVRFLNAPQYLEQVDVKLVELYTTVTDRSGRLVRGLSRDEFEVREDGRPQELTKFELVDDLPLTVGITIDTSGSMVESLPEAKAVALGFLENVITSRDRAFAVSFADRPVLLIPPTDDVGAVAASLEGLRSIGWTTLHDAVVTSLYYFRGIRGRRALVLLSDGDDTASATPFEDAVEYARRSGVAIFCVGLDVGALKVGVRRKLTQLAEETGGRVFFISKASELAAVYAEIEEELRSQYLLAYSSDRPTPDGNFRVVEVDVARRGLEARTIRGYYP